MQTLVLLQNSLKLNIFSVNAPLNKNDLKFEFPHIWS